MIATLVHGNKPTVPAPDDDALPKGLAQAIAAVHSLAESQSLKVAVPYVRYYSLHELAVPEWSRDPGLWEEAFQVCASTPPPTEEGFIHRDYHPGNTLWVGGDLSGILDWQRGTWGPVAIDISHMRVNLARMGHPELADQYTTAYKAMTGRDLSELAYWDVVDAVDLMPEMHTSTAQEKPDLERYVKDGLDSI